MQLFVQSRQLLIMFVPERYQKCNRIKFRRSFTSVFVSNSQTEISAFSASKVPRLFRFGKCIEIRLQYAVDIENALPKITVRLWVRLIRNLEVFRDSETSFRVQSRNFDFYRAH